MKKTIIILFAIIISLNAFSQKKDTVKVDTVFIFSVQDVQILKSILMESKVFINGSPQSGKELQQLFQWIDEKGRVFKKEK